MKLKKFKEKKKVKVSVIVLGCFCLVAVGYLLHRTFASFQTNDTFKMMEGTLDYFGGSDIYFAFYQDNVQVSAIPLKESGYLFNPQKSNCTNGTKITWNQDQWSPIITNLTKTKTKCTVYFDQGKSLVKELLKNETGKNNSLEAKQLIEGKSNPDFSQTSTTDEGMFVTEDDLGTSYYYRGAVANNYVKFAGIYWRIIRINGDGTIRLIYNGNKTDQIGAHTLIKTSSFNNVKNDPAYVGYMYGNELKTNKTQTQANEIDSNVKKILEIWYAENIYRNGATSYLADGIFCNDRNVSSGDGYTINTTTYYESHSRLVQSKMPSLKCPQASDIFTTVSASIGNKQLIYPIGLITADELALAGAVPGKYNQQFYLYTGENYWTMTPCYFTEIDTTASEWHFSHSGDFSALGVWNTPGIRPVINLKANTEITSGTGTANDPYIVS